jgi:hypothetical protein
MAMVRRLSDAMLQADDVQTQVQIGLAFHRVSRAVRQTMALEFRLSQEARRAEHSPKPRPATPTPLEPAVSRPSPERVGWNEYERDDSDEALDALDELLEAEELDIEAVHEAVEASMDRIRRDIAADPLLVKAGVLETGGRTAAPLPRNRRSELLGGATSARPPSLPFAPPGKGGPFADPPAAGKSQGWKGQAAGRAIRSSA